MPKKKYKLSAAPDDGSLRVCAFFASEEGCRNGASCKFSHILPTAVDTPSKGSTQSGEQQRHSAEVSSVVSSESEGETRRPRKMKQEQQSPPKYAVCPPAVDRAPPMKNEDGEKKQKKRNRKKRKSSELESGKEEATTTQQPSSSSSSSSATPPSFRTMDLPVSSTPPSSGPSDAKSSHRNTNSPPSASAAATKAPVDAAIQDFRKPNLPRSDVNRRAEGETTRPRAGPRRKEGSSPSQATSTFRNLNLPMADLRSSSNDRHAKNATTTNDASRGSTSTQTSSHRSSSSMHVEPSSRRETSATSSQSVPDFRKLNLPVANFTLASADRYSKNVATSTGVPPQEELASNVKRGHETGRRNLAQRQRVGTRQQVKQVSVHPNDSIEKGALAQSPAGDNTQDSAEKLPLPESTETGKKWMKAVQRTQEHTDFGTPKKVSKWMQNHGGVRAWIKAKPFGDWCREHPQVIALDCAMCQTRDPVSQETDTYALCRFSVVDASTDEVLINTLVRPDGDVINARTELHGVKQEDLVAVNFTLRHAQAFMMALCSEETVIVGHLLGSDLTALRMEHYCQADAAFLFPSAKKGNPSLKAISKKVFSEDLPKGSDSVNHARVALRLANYFIAEDGNVPSIVDERTVNQKGLQWFIHRIPIRWDQQRLKDFITRHTSIPPISIDRIAHENGFGKTTVAFASEDHAQLAFNFIKRPPAQDAGGYIEKKIYLYPNEYVAFRTNIRMG